MSITTNMTMAQAISGMSGELKDIDRRIVAELAEGRNVPSNIADTTGVSRQYVQQRLQVLEAGDYVVNIGRGVYELVDDPRDDSDV